MIQKTFFLKEIEQVFSHFRKYHMRILLGDFNEKLGRKDTFKPTIGSESLHHDDLHGNDVRILMFATSNNLGVKSTMFANGKIRKYKWTSPGVKTHKQIDLILIHRKCYTLRKLNKLEVWKRYQMKF